MRAGLLDRRIELQSRTLATDGDPSASSWATQATVYAEKMEKRQAERFVSQQTLAEASRIYRVRHRTDVDPTWRVKDGTEVWQVEGVAEGEGRRTETMIVVGRFDPNEATS